MALTKQQKQGWWVGGGTIVALLAFFLIVHALSPPSCGTSAECTPGPIISTTSAAGPPPAQPGSDLPQPGTTQYNNFVATVAAEAVYTGDISPNGTATDGAANWLDKAEQACALLGPSAPDTAVNVVASQGYDTTGAEAIVAAAARVICPDKGYVDWYTQFDKELGTAANNIGSYYGVPISYVNVRSLAQTACRYFGDNQDGPLVTYLDTHSILPEPTGNQRRIDYSNENNVKRVVNEARIAVCPDLKISEYWANYS